MIAVTTPIDPGWLGEKKKPGRHPKATWDNCVICGTDAGLIAPRCKTPGRLSLAKFGKQGRGCLTCYNRLAKQSGRKTCPAPDEG